MTAETSMTDHRMMSYAELSAAWGIGADGARQRVKRRGWDVIPGNYPGAPATVRVPLASMTDKRSGGRTPSVSPINIRVNAPSTPPPKTPDAPSVRGIDPASASVPAAPGSVPAAVMVTLLEAAEARRLADISRLESAHRAEIERLERAHKVAADTLMRKVAGLLVERRKPGFFEALALLWHRPKPYRD